MGLIKAALNAIGGTLEDQYKEYIYCDSMPVDVLAEKGHKKTNGRSTNKGDDNIITDGSAIAVNEGQCALIVVDGKVTEVAAESGVFTFKSDASPSVFSGDLGESIGNTLKDALSRFTYGGMAGRDQRVYYINLKEITGNRYGTASPISFHLVDKNIGFDADVPLRCNGEYSYKIVNPVLFYTNVCNNVTDRYLKSNLDSMLKSEIVTALQTVIGVMGETGMRPSSIPAHAEEITEKLNQKLSKKWGELRGIEVYSFAMNPPTIPPEYEQKLVQLQETAVYQNVGMAAALTAQSQAEAMKIAAGNQGGAMMGFMGMNMAQQAGGMNAQQLYAMQQQMQQQQAAAPAPAPAPAANTWKCSCGADNTGKFCAQCGTPKPADAAGWTCSCGTVNKGKFCAECGKPKPAGAPLYKCDKCGWEPEDPHNPPKFCPECGDPFDASDMV